MFKKTSPPEKAADPARHLSEGDRLRDAGKFAEAAEAYDRYLAVKPDDFGIWVQRGNCLKDSGSLAAAKMAYQQAIRLKDNNADVHLQMGHLLKVTSRPADAITSYKKALVINPALFAATMELKSLGVRVKAPDSTLDHPSFAGKSARLLDISDLLVFMNVHTRVTGIQRVQSCLIKEFLDLYHTADTYAAGNIVFCYCNQDEQSFYGISADLVQSLIEALNSGEENRKVLDEVLGQIYSLKIKLNARPNDVYIILGAFWIGADYSSSLLQLKRCGAKIGVYIYDLIPITHTQFVTESTRQDVQDKFADIMALADFTLTISDYVAKEVIAVLKSELQKTIPVLSVPLAHELPSNSMDIETISDEFKNNLPKEYVLCVCTLEGRKNHLLLLHIWNMLNRKYAGQIPSLLLIGKWGWRIEEFQEKLRAAHNVDGKIVVLGNLSDTELGYVYENCMFTVFPSFVEGWGLPVGESLAYGKPCIASSTSSIPEVGGDFCRYINPYDPVEAFAVIEGAIQNRPDLAAWTKQVANEFKVRTWKDVAVNFLARLDQAVKSAPASSKVNVVLQQGKIYRINHDTIYGDSSGSWLNRAVKFVCASGWRPLESWGCWSSKRQSEITFGTELAEGTKVRLLLELRLPPPTDHGLLVCKINGQRQSVLFNNGAQKFIALNAQVEKDGSVGVAFDREGVVEHLEPNRELYVGLSAIAYHAIDDVGSRLDILESISYLR